MVGTGVLHGVSSLTGVAASRFRAVMRSAPARYSLCLVRRNRRCGIAARLWGATRSRPLRLVTGWDQSKGRTPTLHRRQISLTLRQPQRQERPGQDARNACAGRTQDAGRKELEARRPPHRAQRFRRRDRTPAWTSVDVGLGVTFLVDIGATSIRRRRH